MLTIAGGVIIGILGLWVILAIISAIIENAEDIALGCAVVVGVIALIGAWAFLDEMWPEIDWSKTAVAAVGWLLAAIVVIGFFHDSPLLAKLGAKKPEPEKEETSHPAKDEVSQLGKVEAATFRAPPVSAPKIEEVVPQAAAEPITEETEQEWRARVARELRLSREPKWPRVTGKSHLEKDTEELFSEYIKWKGKPKRDDAGS